MKNQQLEESFVALSREFRRVSAENADLRATVEIVRRELLGAAQEMKRLIAENAELRRPGGGVA